MFQGPGVPRLAHSRHVIKPPTPDELISAAIEWIPLFRAHRDGHRRGGPDVRSERAGANVVADRGLPTRVLAYTDGLIERRDVAIDISIRMLATQLQRHDSDGQRPLNRIADALIDGSDPNVDDNLALLLVSLLPFGGSSVPE